MYFPSSFGHTACVITLLPVGKLSSPGIRLVVGNFVDVVGNYSLMFL